MSCKVRGSHLSSNELYDLIPHDFVPNLISEPKFHFWIALYTVCHPKKGHVALLSWRQCTCPRNCRFGLRTVPRKCNGRAKIASNVLRQTSEPHTDGLRVA